MIPPTKLSTVQTALLILLTALMGSHCGQSHLSGPYWQVAEPHGLGGTFGYGRGAALVDLNGDGHDDLFVADCDSRFRAGDYGLSQFFLNQGDGTFQEADLGVAPTDLLGNWNGLFGDFDNDGDADLFLVNGGYSLESNLAVYENRIVESGAFVERTDALGVAPFHEETHHWWGASFADYNLDGYLDVVVTRREGTPVLFENHRGDAFVEVGKERGLVVGEGGRWTCDLKNPVWWDYDQDGDPDLYLAGRYCHAFYENRDGQFIDETESLFGSLVPSDYPEVFVAAAEDFNQDGLDDLYLGRWDKQDFLLLNQGEKHFTAKGYEFGLDMRLGVGEPYENTMGLGVGDIWDDGYPDLVIGTGDPHIKAQDILLCNQQGRGFERCSDLLHLNVGSDADTYTNGIAFGDIDRDGDSDIFMNLGGHPLHDHYHQIVEEPYESREVSKLFVQEGPKRHNTATLELRGTISNADAIGAHITVSGSDTHYYTVRSAQGFQSQNSRRMVLTLGNDTSRDVIVNWPSGLTSEFTIRSDEQRVVVE